MLAKRLGWHYIRQWVLVATILTISIISIFVWIAERMSALDANRYFSNIGIAHIADSLSLRSDGSLAWSKTLETQVQQAGGWMQILNDQGQELHGFNVPDSVPRQYATGELVANMQRKSSSPYDISVYVKAMDGRELTIIYGEPRVLEVLLDAWLQDHDLMNAELMRNQAWIQLLDKKGDELDYWNKPDTQPEHIRISPSELTLRVMYIDRYEERISYRYDQESGNTWLIRQPFKPMEAAVYMAGIRASSNMQLIGIGGMVLVGITFTMFILMALWQSTRVSRPLMHFMSWSDGMGSGQYLEPERNGRVPSLKRNGKLKSNYRLFGDVWEALRGLSVQLQAAADARQLHDKQREEWLSGLTHDLKTPLASVIGYSHLLTAEQYEWSEQERAEFALMIRQKAERMDILLQDINLTYRLNSHSLRLQLERTELNEWLGEVMRQLIPPDRNNKAAFTLKLGTNPIILDIDRRYMVRAVENVVMNAWIHNSPDTHLMVTLSESKQKVLLSFHDDGEGMSSDMLEHLFTRYYRGTSTDVTDQGSGLGMAITKQLVEAHGGNVSVLTTLGVGTEISFHFTK